jgi:hypothetical protein
MDNKDEKRSSLEQFQDKLNAKDSKLAHVKELDFRQKAYDVKRDWQEKIESGEAEEYIIEKKPFFQKLLVISAIFFGVALVVSAGLFLFGSNSISTENVIINASGPVRVEAGEEASFEIKVTNKNNITLQDAVLAVRFPANTRDSENLDEELKRVEYDIGEIPEGGVINERVSAVLFGEEGSSQELIISVEYTVEGSTATFQVEKLYTVVISSTPISVRVEGEKEAGSGSEVNLSVTVASNSNVPVNNLVLEARYPFGFDFSESDPSPDIEDNKWRFDKLDPNETQTIELSGVIAGQDSEERNFQFTIGIEDTQEAGVIKTPVFSVSHTLVLSKPALALDILVNRSGSQEAVVADGGKATVSVVWENTSTTNVVGRELVVELGGNVLNKGQVKVSNGGFYNSGANTITWTSDRTSELREIRPGQGGTVSFEVTPTNYVLGEYPASPHITAEAQMTGNSPSRSDREAILLSQTDVIIKVATELGITARLLRQDGPIENFGPIPPEAEEETSYTVAWALSNTANEVGGARVTAKLPPNVEWTGNTFPADESISYIPSERQVVWEAGNVSSGTDPAGSPREVFFQVVITPSANQAGSAPAVVGATAASGRDQYTGIAVSSNSSSLNTVFGTDSSYDDGDGRVRP